MGRDQIVAWRKEICGENVIKKTRNMKGRKKMKGWKIWKQMQ
jgi:hypothetical protein